MLSAIKRTNMSSSDSTEQEIEKSETEDSKRVRVLMPIKSGKYSIRRSRRYCRI